MLLIADHLYLSWFIGRVCGRFSFVVSMSIQFALVVHVVILNSNLSLGEKTPRTRKSY